MADSKIYNVDKFLGLNEMADSETELKAGEASKIENFSITDGYNLKRRPGTRVLERLREGKILGLYSGYMCDIAWRCRAVLDGSQVQLHTQADLCTVVGDAFPQLVVAGVGGIDAAVDADTATVMAVPPGWPS